MKNPHTFWDFSFVYYVAGNVSPDVVSNAGVPIGTVAPVFPTSPKLAKPISNFNFG